MKTVLSGWSGEWVGERLCLLLMAPRLLLLSAGDLFVYPLADKECG